MSEHLSALQLDTAAAGETPADTLVHLSTCPHCQGRLETLKAQNAAWLAQPRAMAQLRALTEAPPLPLKRRRWLMATVLAAPLAAGVLLALSLRAPPDERIKGHSEVALLDAAGNAVTRAEPGQLLTLTLGAAGQPYGAVFTVDRKGNIELLWPESTQMAAVPEGARVPVQQLQVTPGAVLVLALFSAQRLPLAPLQQAIAAEVASERVSPVDIPPPDGVDSARVLLEVRR